MFKNTANTSVCSGLFCCFFLFLFVFFHGLWLLTHLIIVVDPRQRNESDRNLFTPEILSFLLRGRDWTRRFLWLDHLSDDQEKKKTKNKKNIFFLKLQDIIITSLILLFCRKHRTSNNRKNHGFFCFVLFFCLFLIFFLLSHFRVARCPQMDTMSSSDRPLLSPPGASVKTGEREQYTKTGRERPREREREGLSHLKPITAQSD